MLTFWPGVPRRFAVPPTKIMQFFARMDTTDQFVICFFFSFRCACLFFFQDLILSSFRFVSLVRCKFHKKKQLPVRPRDTKVPKDRPICLACWHSLNHAFENALRETDPQDLCCPEVRHRPLERSGFSSEMFCLVIYLHLTVAPWMSVLCCSSYTFLKGSWLQGSSIPLAQLFAHLGDARFQRRALFVDLFVWRRLSIGWKKHRYQMVSVSTKLLHKVVIQFWKAFCREAHVLRCCFFCWGGL